MTSYNVGPVKPWVQSAADEIGTMFNVRTIYGFGARGNVSDHPLGLALDFMTPGDSAKGDQIANYAISNYARLGITYLIWRQRIYSGSEWEPMEDRGSTTANHYDHVHISFTSNGKAEAGASNGNVGNSNSGSGGGSNPLIPDELEMVASGVGWILDPHNLMRVGAVALGGALLIFALFQVSVINNVRKAVA